jgi:monoamine oxidase
MTDKTHDVVVIGAGMAGLTAARKLAEAGVEVLVIEAQDRIGGRILTEHVGGEAIELGAEFIHGRPLELWALIDEAGLETYERGGAQVCFEDGVLVDCGSEMEEVFDPLEALRNYEGPDMNFAQYLDRRQLSAEARGRAIGYVEGFNAADHHEVSSLALGAQQKAADAIGTDHSYSLRGGYDQLPAYLAGRTLEYGGRVLTGTTVSEIRWQRGRAEIVTGAGTFLAACAVITLPLGVLQRGAVTISPRPDSVLNAAEQLRMGQARRFTLLFNERFWEHLPPQLALHELSFLFAFSEMPPVWWTQHPNASHSITGWVGGPRSSALAGLDANELARRACTALAKIFNLDENKICSMLRGSYSRDWYHDPCALGVYSYVAMGGLHASRQMSEPVENTLFFAGEHTDITGHWGTVHAALRSGLRAAQQILALNNRV